MTVDRRKLQFFKERIENNYREWDDTDIEVSIYSFHFILQEIPCNVIHIEYILHCKIFHFNVGAPLLLTILLSTSYTVRHFNAYLCGTNMCCHLDNISKVMHIEYILHCKTFHSPLLLTILYGYKHYCWNLEYIYGPSWILNLTL